MISLEINTTFKDINFVSIFKKEKEESNTIKLVSSVKVSIVVALFVSNRIFHHNYSCVHIIHSDNYIVILVIQIIRNDRNNWTFVFFFLLSSPNICYLSNYSAFDLSISLDERPTSFSSCFVVPLGYTFWFHGQHYTFLPFPIELLTFIFSA